jgi:hypothetical protein
MSWKSTTLHFPKVFRTSAVTTPLQASLALAAETPPQTPQCDARSGLINPVGKCHVEAELRFAVCSAHFSAASSTLPAAQRNTRRSLQAAHVSALVSLLVGRPFIEDCSVTVQPALAFNVNVPTLHRRLPIPRMEFGVAGAKDLIWRGTVSKTQGWSSELVPVMPFDVGTPFPRFHGAAAAPQAEQTPHTTHHLGMVDPKGRELIVGRASVKRERLLAPSCFSDDVQREVSDNVLKPITALIEARDGKASAAHHSVWHHAGMRWRYRRSYRLPDGIRLDITAVCSSKFDLVCRQTIPLADVASRLPPAFLRARRRDLLGETTPEAWVRAVAESESGRSVPFGFEVELEFMDGEAALRAGGDEDRADAAEVLAYRGDKLADEWRRELKRRGLTDSQ